jgi:hypothetical protein
MPANLICPWLQADAQMSILLASFGAQMAANKETFNRWLLRYLSLSCGEAH